jgi:hypothetical protein
MSFLALLAGLGTMTMPKKANAGMGPCSVSGCPCKQFLATPGNTYMCQNCGHNYTLHW